MFPASLRAYVERALSRCKDEGQKSACQDIMKEVSAGASPPLKSTNFLKYLAFKYIQKYLFDG